MRIVGIFFGLWLAATSAFAQDADAIEDVIGNQLSAFNERDMPAPTSSACSAIPAILA